jgi:hypothetical protein
LAGLPEKIGEGEDEYECAPAPSLIALSPENSAEHVVKFVERHLIGDRDQADDHRAHLPQNDRRIKRLKETLFTISPDYSDRSTPDFLALSKNSI